jgi:hypothetical protein
MNTLKDYAALSLLFRNNAAFKSKNHIVHATTDFKINPTTKPAIAAYK